MAGIDSSNQFPNSRMAQAVKLGHSRFISADTPSRVWTADQKNVSIAAATHLTIPAPSATTPGNYMPVTYAVITAVGGTMYVTYDGVDPSAASYEIAVAAGASLPVQGAEALAAIKIQGTSASISYWT